MRIAHTLVWATIAALTVAVSACGSIASKGTADAGAQSAAAPVITTTSVVAVTTRPPLSGFDDGVWIAGADMPAGRYRTAAPVVACSWATSNPGSGVPVLIASGYVTGGSPVVDLKAGEQIKSDGCGKWVKD